jgi:tRNA(Ile)-lysidine synthetase-like protein
MPLFDASLIPTGARVLVAFSGGPDSTALLVSMRAAGVDVVAAHFDHALQPGSALFAEHAARLCGALEVELIIERRQVPLPPGSVQAAARALRYDFLERVATQAGATTIAVAHTADDVVEGTVLHLLRGCGIAGLRGMPARRGRIVRPLLNVWRRDIDAYLDRRGIVAVDDPANFDRRYARVTVRRDLMPALERDRPGITRRLRAVASRAVALQQEIERGADEVVTSGPVTRETIARLSDPVAVEVLRRLYATAAGRLPGLARTHLSAMLGLTRGGAGGRGVDLPDGLRFRIVAGELQVVPRVAPVVGFSLAIKQCPGCEDQAAAHLKPGLKLRLGFRQPGLSMRPAHGRGTRKLQDIFVDAHVPREDRDHWPLVFAGERLAWVPGVAVDRDLRADRGEVSLHVTVTRILSDRSSKVAMLESPDSRLGEP